MGLLTWIIIGIVILAIIGLGLGTFLSGVWRGAQEVSSNPFVENATEEGKEYVGNATENATDQLVDNTLKSSPE